MSNKHHPLKKGPGQTRLWDSSISKWGAENDSFFSEHPL